MRRMNLLFTLTVVLMMIFTAVATAADDNFPKIIQLPNGWRPEGIAAGEDEDFYVGSLANGAIYKGDLRTGVGAILVPGQTGRLTVGLKYSERSKLLFTAGGPAGVARVFNAKNGTEVATIQLSAAPAFINDVVITRDAAYFTNSQKAEVYKVLLTKKGELTNPVQVQTLTLSGDWQQVAGFNANGIEASKNGKQLIVVNSTTGLLYTVDPNNGASKLIDLAGATVTAGDGILLDGRTLYVMRNQINQIAVVKLAKGLASGQIVNTISDPAFRVPTTIMQYEDFIYAVNARFGTPPTPDTDYDVVQVSKPAEHESEEHESEDE